MHRYYSIIIVGLFAIGLSHNVLAQAKEYMHGLEKLLMEYGIEKTRAYSILSDSRLKLDPEIVVNNLFYSKPKPKADVEQPDVMDIDPAYIDKGKAFIDARKEVFFELEKNYGVSAQIITAILIVETRLGTYPQKYTVINAYASLAACLDQAYFENLRDTYHSKYPAFSDKETRERARKKAFWAANQLYQLILLAQGLKLDPFEIRGSFAGALGPGQFIPSSFMEFGVDGDHDGIRDPFNMLDAMASIANYLQRSGWRDTRGIKQQRQAIWYYNHSDVYVNTVMMLYRELSG